jgi:DNA-binding HxlR family transcriptional regulator
MRVRYLFSLPLRIREAKRGGNMKKHQSGCPVANGLDIFGDRWSLLIVRDMMLKGRQTFNELQKLEEGIAPNILADRIGKLVKSGIITRTPNPEDKRVNILTLTRKGLDLAPLVVDIISWSGKYYPLNTAARKKLVKRIAANREEVLQEIYRRSPPSEVLSDHE